MPAKTTNKNMTILRQMCELIPTHLVPKLANAHGVSFQTYTPWSHVVTHIYCHLFRAVGLNDVCDAMGLFISKLRSIRGAAAPRRNTLSTANSRRSSGMAKDLYWSMLELLQKADPSFTRHGGRRRGFIKRFRKAIHAVDSTTIELVANCMPWAQHRRRKAAAKCHMNLNLATMLPRYAVVGSAKDADAKRAPEICAPLRAGEIVVFDKAYLAFEHLRELHERGVFWVNRTKTNTRLKVIKVIKGAKNPRVLKDEWVRLTSPKSEESYPETLRRVTVQVVLDGEEKVMEFLTNNLEWSPWTVAELYRARWEIEVFFKELKQTLTLVDFIGYSRNAVEWQIWMALLVHLLMRFLAHLSKWERSFTRLFTLLRAALWHNYPIRSFLESYGTADTPFRICACPNQLYLPGIGASDEYPVGQPRRRKQSQSRKYKEFIQRKNQPNGENKGQNE